MSPYWIDTIMISSSFCYISWYLAAFVFAERVDHVEAENAELRKMFNDDKQMAGMLNGFKYAAVGTWQL